MSDERLGSRLAALLGTLKPRSKQPASVRVLNTWIAQAEGELGDEAKGGRLGWLIASSVAIAAVQRAIDAEGRHLFLLKGGTLLQHRLNTTARSTKDVDGLIRGDLDAFILALEEALDEPWGPLTLRRGEVEIVNVSGHRSSTRFPIRTSRRTPSTIARVTLSTSFCSVTWLGSPVVQRWPRSARLRRLSSLRGLMRRSRLD